MGEEVSTPPRPPVAVPLLIPRMGLPMTQCHQETRTPTRSDLLPSAGHVVAAPGASSAPGPSRTLNQRRPAPAPQSLAPGRPQPVAVSPSPRVGDPPSSSSQAADSPFAPGESPLLPAAAPSSSRTLPCALSRASYSRTARSPLDCCADELAPES
ncbi:hypothetical protein Taro_036553 [Colocasia esculenta]|uniref:Uncharacterized protein n=1 Tax=Colocasia esculenta TaxID=4460 RepID=A0A843WI65_COLES|nr:hypothetical protein [Colocasia esculenta]